MEGGYDDDEEVGQYVKAVRERLDATVVRAVTYEQIVVQLEKFDYEVSKVVKALNKAHAPKAPGPSTAVKTVATKSSSSTTTVKTSTYHSATRPQPTATDQPIHSDAPQAPLNNVFTKVSASSAATLMDTTQESEELLISDNEIEPEQATDHSNPDPSTSSIAKENLTLAVVGHVDSGKSTLVGHLLYKIGQVNSRTIQKYERESEEIGKGSFSLAWVLDEREAEREHGVTIDVAEKVITTPQGREFTVLDTPGHKDYVPNMIKGATQADVAILLIPAAQGEYESCMKDSAQTKEHAFLLKALGVTQIIVAINKMDHTLPTPWSAERYHQIASEITHFLVHDLQFTERQVRCIPVSGLVGENILSVSESCPMAQWYSGPSIVDGLDLFRSPPKNVNKPFRAIVHSCTVITSGSKKKGEEALQLEVTVLQGRVSQGRSLGLACYSGRHCKMYRAELVTMTVDPAADSSTPTISARDHAFITITVKTGSAGGWDEEIGSEMVLFKGPPLPKVCTQFRASLLTTSSLSIPIIPGSVLELYLKGVELQCKIGTLHSVAGTAAGKRPKIVPPAKSAVVSIKLSAPAGLIEPFAVCRALGRFALRSKGSTVAVGVCEAYE